jgi:hypothetical protein
VGYRVTAADPAPAAELACRCGGGPHASGKARLQGRRPARPQRSSPAWPAADLAHVAKLTCRGCGPGAAVHGDPPTSLRWWQRRRVCSRGPRPHGRPRQDRRAPREMRHGFGAATPVSASIPPRHVVKLRRPASSLPQQQSRQPRRQIPPSLARVRWRIRWLLLSLLSCGVASAWVEIPSLLAPVVVRHASRGAKGKVGNGREGGNFTFNQRRIISFYCAIYQI